MYGDLGSTSKVPETNGVDISSNSKEDRDVEGEQSLDGDEPLSCKEDGVFDHDNFHGSHNSNHNGAIIKSEGSSSALFSKTNIAIFSEE